MNLKRILQMYDILKILPIININFEEWM